MVIKLLLILFFFPSQLLNPLLRLRQACCHPQAVRGGYLSVQKRYMLLLRDSILKSVQATRNLQPVLSILK